MSARPSRRVSPLARPAPGSSPFPSRVAPRPPKRLALGAVGSSFCGVDPLVRHFFADVFLARGLHAVGGRRQVLPISVASVDCLVRRPHVLDAIPRLHSSDIGRSLFGSVASRGDCSVVVAPSVAPSYAWIQSSKVILRGQVTVVDLGFVSDGARPDAGGLANVSRSYFGSIVAPLVKICHSGLVVVVQWPARRVREAVRCRVLPLFGGPTVCHADPLP